MKKLPIGIQDFREIISNNYIYVDKTKFIYDLVNSGKYYFLSRPRRFGKSLLVSTMYYLFKGEKELFKGLYIYDKWNFEEYPIVRLDISAINTENKKTIEESLKDDLKKIYESYGIEWESVITSDVFKNLIIRLYEKYNKQVVVLIDEYDKAILDHIDKNDIDEIREFFRNFYGILKPLDPYLKFVFITGISKFSKVSLFSQLNNLNDISLNYKYSAICGFTFDEIETYFKDHIQELAEFNKISYEEALEKIKYWYNGYCFSRNCTKVINPFSLLNCLDNMEFRNYWIDSGTPSFIVKYFRNNHGYYDLEMFDGIGISYTSLFPKPIIDKTTPESFLFQAGYLTIVDWDEEGYILSYPNVEVKSSLAEIIITYGYNILDSLAYNIIKDIKNGLFNNDPESIKQGLNLLFANIPYNLHINRESLYHSLIYTALLMCGLNARNEDPNNIGRSDIVVEYYDRIWILEIKLDQPVEKALDQIKEKEYFNKYPNNEVTLIGVSIDSKKREIKEILIEKV